MSQERPSLWTTMENSYDQSPVHRALGLSMAVLDAGHVAVSHDGTPAAANRRGNIAGGSLAEMIDSAVVQATKSLIGADDKAATLELKVNFVAPGEPGARLVARARIDHLGKSTSVGTGRVETEDGKLVALGIVTVSIRRQPATTQA